MFSTRIVMQQMIVTTAMVPIIVIIGTTIRQVGLIMMLIGHNFPRDNIYDTTLVLSLFTLNTHKYIRLLQQRKGQ